MITPRFSCDQTDEHVIVKVYCPAIRASDVDIHVDDTLLTIHINPYFLRLNFPHPVSEEDGSAARYDAGAGFLHVTLNKQVKGQEFKDLDLLSKLLAPRPTQAQTPAIEVISSQEADTARADDDVDRLSAQAERLTLEQDEFLQAEENEWQYPQTVPEPLDSLNIKPEKPYGFLNMYSGYLTHVALTENEVNELGADAETMTPQMRRERRIAHENEKWDEEHYMADYADDEYIQELLQWRPPYTSETVDEFTEDEKLMMLRLPRKEYIATQQETDQLYATLITILFAYAYEARTTQMEPTPESAWTLCSLTPAFSALDPPPYAPGPPLSSENLATALVPSYRRTLSFPLYRSFALAEACRADVASLLARGKRTVLRSLLATKSILDRHEVYYLYSKLWLDDFCVWVQGYASDDTLMDLGTRLGTLKVRKDDLGWDLEALEEAARAALNGEAASDSDDESEDDANGPTQL
ncbi:SHQ1 protein-domain-containing protein [Schizophyllum commune]